MTRWTLDYIEDAATARLTIRRRGRPDLDDNSNYAPLEGAGVHLCGQTDDGKQPTTVANYRMMDHAEAQHLWTLAKLAAECASREEEDFLVDLVTSNGIIADFSSNRQLWPRAIDAWNADHV